VELIRVILFRRDGLECELSVARDGSEALRAVREAARRGAPIDLVLLDINMPGMDGFEFLEQLRSDRELGETAVVMCTGSTYEKDRHRARALGALGTLVKPPSRDAFCEVLRGVERLRVQSDRRASRLVRVG